MRISKNKRTQTLVEHSKLEQRINILENDKINRDNESELKKETEKMNKLLKLYGLTVCEVGRIERFYPYDRLSKGLQLKYKNDILKETINYTDIGNIKKIIEYIEENKTILELLKSKKKK